MPKQQVVLNGRMIRYSPAHYESFEMSLDTTDNIPGLHGFGNKALEKFQEQTENSSSMEKLIMCIKTYTDKKGVLNGMDLFAEMWALLSMRLQRGKHNYLKYKKGFDLVKSFIETE